MTWPSLYLDKPVLVMGRSAGTYRRTFSEDLIPKTSLWLGVCVRPSLQFFLELTTQNLEPWTRNLEPWTLNLEPWILNLKTRTWVCFRRLLLSGWTINAHFYADLFLIRLKTQNRPNGELENNTLNRRHLDSPHCPPLPRWSHGTNTPNRHLVVLHILAVTVQLDGFLTWFLFSQNVIVRTRLYVFFITWHCFTVFIILLPELTLVIM